MHPNDVRFIQLRVSGGCPLICWSMPYVCASSKLKELLCVNAYKWYIWWCIKSAIALQSKYIKLFRDVATVPSLTTDHMFLPHSLNFGGVQWSGCRNCSRLNLLLLLTLHPCRFPFYMQVMILMRSYYRLSSLAVTSVDGCCLYIIIQNSISCRTSL